MDHSTSTNTENFVLKEAGHYLFMYNVAAEDLGGNNRRRFRFRVYNVTGAADTGYGKCAGYIRDTSNCLTLNAFGATLLSVSANTTIRVEVLDGNDLGTDIRAALSGVQIIKLDDSWDYFRAQKTSTTSITSGATYIDVPWESAGIDEEDTGSFEHDPDGDNESEIKLKKSGKYLIAANISGVSDTSGRTGGSARLLVNGTELDGSRIVLYMRETSTNDMDTTFFAIVDVAADDYIKFQANEITSPNTPGWTCTADSSITITKLKDDIDYLRLGRVTSSISVTDNLDIEWNEEKEKDTGSFAHSNSTNPDEITIQKTADYLFLSTFNTERTTISGSARSVSRWRWLLGGTEVQYGGGDSYNRGSQGDNDVYESGTSLGLVGSFSNTDTIKINNVEDGTGAGDVIYPTDGIGLQAVNLTQLFEEDAAEANAPFLGCNF
jgi:hypothetical protein